MKDQKIKDQLQKLGITVEYTCGNEAEKKFLRKLQICNNPSLLPIIRAIFIDFLPHEEGLE